MRITFAGAAGTVTGSRYLLQTKTARILVDCGLFQGLKSLRERNWERLPFDPKSLDAVVLTHAHIDHSGYLPRLIQSGYRGPVYCTPGTAELLGILLPDAGYLQEEEARHANARGYAHHHPALPLYTREQAEHALTSLKSVGFDTPFDAAEGVRVRFTRAGHIVGSASLLVEAEGVRVAFSGDVGRPNDPIMRPPAPLPACDVLVVESTYGDRRHPVEDPSEAIEKVVLSTLARGGSLIVPAFAVGRAQHLLHILAELRAAGRIPFVPTYLDSPMAISATQLFQHATDDHRLDPAACAALDSIATYTRTPDESRALDASDTPKIIISASGMATGGRVLHHLRRFLPDERSTVLVVGYQAAGTRGRALLEGADELKIHGQYVTVRARIAQVAGLSAHADYTEILAWLQRSDVHPAQVFVTHGEPSAADALRRRLRDTLGLTARVAVDGETVTVGE